MSLLVIDFTNLVGRGGDIVVKEIAVVDFQSTRVSLYVFKRRYGCLTLERVKLLTTGVIGIVTGFGT